MTAVALIAAAAILGDLFLVRKALKRSNGLRRPPNWVLGVPVVVVALVVGGPFLYLKVIEKQAPAPLSFANLESGAGASTPAGSAPAGTTPGIAGSTAAPGTSAPTTTSGPGKTATPAATGSTAVPAVPLASTSPVSGSWKVGPGSQAGYRINETVLGQSTPVVGRTRDVTGDMKIAETAVTAVHVVVNMKTVKCNCVHDSAFQGSLLNTSAYPTSTFVLTQPIQLGSIPDDGVVISVPAVGDFTIHGVTHRVAFTVKARRQAGRIEVNGEIPFQRSDYNITAPSGGPVGQVDQHGVIELLLAFDRTS